MIRPIELTLTLTTDAIDALAQRIASALSQPGQRNSPWLTRPQAADYLKVPLSRLEKDRTVPCHRWDGRVLYHRDELDAHLLNLDRD